MDKVILVRKKPIAVSAVYYHDSDECRAFLEEWGVELQPDYYDNKDIDIWNIREKCWVRCPVGHYVIRGVANEFYPCDPEVFHATYELEGDA